MSVNSDLSITRALKSPDTVGTSTEPSVRRYFVVILYVIRVMLSSGVAPFLPILFRLAVKRVLHEQVRRRVLSLLLRLNRLGEGANLPDDPLKALALHPQRARD